mgnify:CR=1 FL=1
MSALRREPLCKKLGEIIAKAIPGGAGPENGEYIAEEVLKRLPELRAEVIAHIGGIDATAIDGRPALRDVVYAPRRVQLSRRAGYRKPEGAVVVARPSRWGNPFPISGDWIVWTALALGYRCDKAGRREAAVALHRAWLTGAPVVLGPGGAPPVDRYANGGVLVFSDGVEIEMSEWCRGIAGAFSTLVEDRPTLPPRPTVDEIRAALAGRDLACWCPLAEPCHADVLLTLANS